VHAETGLCKLPQFRPVALKLLKLVSGEEVDFKVVANLLSSDPAFSAEILALANSSLYAASCPTTSLTRAILILGLERTRSLTLTVAMQAFVGNVHITPELQSSWRHSVACALAAEELAPLYKLQSDHGYTAGLMHDLGRLGLMKAYPGKYATVLRNSFASVADVLEAERQTFKMDHCQAGAWLTRSWGFPAEFQAIAEHHHIPRFGAEQGLVGLTAAACTLSDALGFPSIPFDFAGDIQSVIEALPGSPRIDLEDLRERIAERLQSVDLR
jgi:putative nucleotidyltransferase with HDIG domain